MTDRPILFSGPMVRALLDGRKRQTRRIVKLDVPVDSHEVFFWSGEALRRAGWTNVSEPGLWARRNGRDGYIQHVGRCPYGVPGDRLWVKETHLGGSPGVANVIYRADGEVPGVRWRPSIHMPRRASRLTLVLTDIRVERLQDISEADAEAEGVQDPSLVPILGAFWSSRDGYARLWNHINGKGSWEANPWVWAVTFEVERSS